MIKLSAAEGLVDEVCAAFQLTIELMDAVCDAWPPCAHGAATQSN
jgi:hypothetical protein